MSYGIKTYNKLASNSGRVEILLAVECLGHSDEASQSHRAIYFLTPYPNTEIPFNIEGQHMVFM